MATQQQLDMIRKAVIKVTWEDVLAARKAESFFTNDEGFVYVAGNIADDVFNETTNDGEGLTVDEAVNLTNELTDIVIDWLRTKILNVM